MSFQKMHLSKRLMSGFDTKTEWSLCDGWRRAGWVGGGEGIESIGYIANKKNRERKNKRTRGGI